MGVGLRLILALVLGMSLVMFLIMKTKIQAFPALLIAALFVGFISGMPTGEIISELTKGFGGTLSSIGIVIGLGVMMGKVLEVSGAAKKMSLSILNIVGEEKTELVLLISGWVVSIPVFCDSGFVILSELAKEFSRNTKKSMIALGCSLGIGLYLTHHLVPPTPGPLGVAGIVGADVGKLILWGGLISIIAIPILVIYVKYISKKFNPIIPDLSDEAKKFVSEQNNLPNAFLSFMPILIPVVLILVNTVSKSLGIESSLISTFGNPVVAVLIGLILSIYTLTTTASKKDVIKTLENSLSDAGLILCITGAGGALGAILRVSGVGNHVANLIASTSIPAILIPIIMPSLLKLSQGSGTVALITSASILAPMMQGLGLSPIITALAVCSGGMLASFINDSFFWVVTKFSGMSVEVGTRAWTSTTAVCGLICSVLVVILSFFI